MHQLIYQSQPRVIEWPLHIFRFLCARVWPDPAHTPLGGGTGGAPHQTGDVRTGSVIAIIPAAAAPACPGGIPDPGKAYQQ